MDDEIDNLIVDSWLKNPRNLHWYKEKKINDVRLFREIPMATSCHGYLYIAGNSVLIKFEGI